jgi:hypothetical protein
VRTYEQAAARIDATLELEPHRATILYDWPEGDAHYTWAATCDLAELVSGAETATADEEGDGQSAQGPKEAKTMLITTTERALSKARFAAGTLPPGGRLAGLVERTDGTFGALCRLPNGHYVQVNAGIVRSLSQAAVGRALLNRRP